MGVSRDRDHRHSDAGTGDGDDPARRRTRRAQGSTSAIVGNSVGVLFWGALSAVGISSLILASRIAYDVLRLGGAAVLVVLGIRSLLRRTVEPGNDSLPVRRRSQAGWRTRLVTSMSNPKLAAFFVALLPQFLRPGANVLPIALGMAVTIVCFDLIWFSTLALTVEQTRKLLGPRVQQSLERISGAVMVVFGLKLASEAR